MNLTYFHTKVMGRLADMSIRAKISNFIRITIRWKLFHRMKVLDGQERKDYLEIMTYELVEAYKQQNNGKRPPIVYMNCSMFELSRQLKEKSGIDVKLPYFWYIKGVEVVWEDFTDKLVVNLPSGIKFPIRSDRW